MKCYRCFSPDLRGAEITPYEQKLYHELGIRMLTCGNCGLDQNHQGDDDPVTIESPDEFAQKRILAKE